MSCYLLALLILFMRNRGSELLSIRTNHTLCVGIILNHDTLNQSLILALGVRGLKKPVLDLLGVGCGFMLLLVLDDINWNCLILIALTESIARDGSFRDDPRFRRDRLLGLFARRSFLTRLLRRGHRTSLSSASRGLLLDFGSIRGDFLCFSSGLEHGGDVPVDVFPKTLPIIMLNLAILLNLKLALFFTQFALIFSFLALLVLLGFHFLLSGLFFLSLIFGGLLLGLCGDNAFEIDNSLLEAMNFCLEAHQLLVDLEGLLVLLLAFEGVSERQKGVHVVLAVLNTFLEVGDRLRVLAPNVV